MQITLIRNATLLLTYADQLFLIDPDFAPKHSRPSFTGKSPNPMVDLPRTPEAIMEDIQWILVSHLHQDHFDTTAQTVLPKGLPLICQPENMAIIQEKGFTNLIPVQDTISGHGITLTRIGGHHGLGEVGQIMGSVAGFVFQAEGEPTLYWAGDTVLCDEVEQAITQFQPQIVITHSCGANWPDSTGERQLIVMDAAQTVQVCQRAPQIIAVHMEALDHATVSRQDLRAYANQMGITDQQLLIPSDGETLNF